jgi:hypothetical protein
MERSGRSAEGAMMANLDDLCKSITEISFDEALGLIRGIRLSRRTPKKAIKSKTKKPSTTKKSSETLFAMLTPEQKEKLLKELTS